MGRIVELDNKPRGATEASEVVVSFFVPCFNEEFTVVGALDKLDLAARRLGIAYEILVVDDCSLDRTVAVVKDYQARRPEVPLTLFTNAVNRGVSRNFVEGAFHARGRHYRQVCGDDCETLESHVDLLRRVGEADVVVPYFTKIEGRKLYRHVISRTYTLLVNAFSGFRLRYYNGCPVYRTADVQRFHVETTGFGYQAEFLTRLLNERRSYVEVPMESRDREGGTSLSVRGFFSVWHTLIKISLRRLRVYLLK
jgi:glycosyltransferase involved in cell wall biosynthesis